MTSSTSRRIPDFVVIGAMKCGTTTFYNDLASQSAICMSTVKEPAVLVRMTDPSRAADYYGKLFRPEASHQRLGEASTHYTQRPKFTGVAERARAVCGPDLRAIYLVRNPVERALSHHYHLIARGHATDDLDTMVRRDERLVDYGRYAMQLEPWIATFGLPQILVLRFEDYVRDRAETMRQVGRFLGVPVDVERLPAEKAFNQGEETRAPGSLRPLIRSDLYRLWLRRLLPAWVRGRLRRSLMESQAGPRSRPRADTVDFLVQRLGEDSAELARLLGWQGAGWDLDATRKKYAGPPG